MLAGSLNKRVTFQSFASVPDGGGGSTKTWTDYVTVWAQFSPERGRERIQAGRIDTNAAGVLRIRSSTAARAIDTTYRVSLNGGTWDITAIINPDQRNDMLEMTIEQQVND